MFKGLRRWLAEFISPGDTEYIISGDRVVVHINGDINIVAKNTLDGREQITNSGSQEGPSNFTPIGQDEVAGDDPESTRGLFGGLDLPECDLGEAVD